MAKINIPGIRFSEIVYDVYPHSFIISLLLNAFALVWKAQLASRAKGLGCPVKDIPQLDTSRFISGPYTNCPLTLILPATEAVMSTIMWETEALAPNLPSKDRSMMVHQSANTLIAYKGPGRLLGTSQITLPTLDLHRKGRMASTLGKMQNDPIYATQTILQGGDVHNINFEEFFAAFTNLCVLLNIPVELLDLILAFDNYNPTSGCNTVIGSREQNKLIFIEDRPTYQKAFLFISSFLQGFVPDGKNIVSLNDVLLLAPGINFNQLPIETGFPIRRSAPPAKLNDQFTTASDPFSKLASKQISAYNSSISQASPRAAAAPKKAAKAPKAPPAARKRKGTEEIKKTKIVLSQVREPFFSYWFKKKKNKSNSNRETLVPENGKTIQKIKLWVLAIQQSLAVALRKSDKILSKKLISKLLRSKDARILAVFNTISAKGYRSKGYLDIKPTTNEEYSSLVSQLWKIVKYPISYKATPLKRKMLPKPKGGLRPISVPTYLDRSLQHLYKLALEVICEETQSPYSFGFRPYRSPGWATRSLIFATWPLSYCPKFALELDIAKCFDTMDHAWMLSNVASVSLGPSLPTIDIIPPHILNQWLKCGFILIDDVSNTVQATTGIPQGGPISPTIANIVLNGIENVILQVAKDHKLKIHPARFADDITLIFNDYILYQPILEAVDNFLKPRGMRLNKEKCFLRKLTMREPFNFVGFSHHMVRRRRPKVMFTRTRKKNFTLLNFPLKGKVTALKSKISKILLNYKRPAHAVFEELNPILRGWLNFYCCANSSATFKRLSWWLWHKVWFYFWKKYKSMAIFRKKSRTYKHLLGKFIRTKFTKPTGRAKEGNKPLKTKWWYVPMQDTIKKVQDLPLVCPALHPITQPLHIQFREKGSALSLNAFHPSDRIILETYAIHWKLGNWGKVLKKTQGCCAKCNISLMDPDQLLELHHVNPIKFGGSRTIPNLLPLCTECHKEVSIAVAKKDLVSIIQFEDMKILKGVSAALSLLSPS